MKKKFSEIATRANSLDFFENLFFYPNPDKILKDKGDDISIYEELLSDDHVRAVTRTRIANILNLEWKITENDTSKTIIDYVIAELNRLDVYQIITSAMQAAFFGFKVFELNFDNTKIESIKGKPCRWFAFDKDNQLLFKSKTNPSGEIVPQAKFLLATQDADEINPYGFPDLSCCYWYVIFKKGNIKFWIKFLEKYGMPWTIAKAPPQTSEPDKDDLLEKINDLLEDGTAVIDDTSDIEFIESGGKQQSGTLYNDFLNFCNASISKAILGSTLTTENTEGVGSQALGSVHERTTKAIISSDKHMICTFFNKIIKLIIDLRFGVQQKYPFFEMNSPQEINETIADRDIKLKSIGVKFKRDYFKKTYGFSDDDFDIVDSSEYSEPPHIADSAVKDSAYWDNLINEIEKCEDYTEAKEKMKSYIKEETQPELQENLGKIFLLGEMTGEASV